jgi:hypothetical protein
MMNRWKATMIAAATIVSHGHGDSSSVSGAMISTTVPWPCAMKVATCDGSRSWG